MLCLPLPRAAAPARFSRSWDRQGWGGGGGKPAPRGRSHQVGSPVGQGPSDTQGGARLVGERKHVLESAGSAGVGPYCTLPFIWGDAFGDQPPACPPQHRENLSFLM